MIEDVRSIPLATPLRELIAAKDSPNSGEFRRLGFGRILAQNLGGILII